MNKKIFIYFFFLLIWKTGLVFSLEQKSDFVSDRSIASVVQIGKTYDIYKVAGLPDNYEINIRNGKPNFGPGKVISKQEKFVNIGSGVIVSNDGWIFTNYHVAEDKIQVQLLEENGKVYQIVLVPKHPNYLLISTATVDEVSKYGKVKLRYLAESRVFDVSYSLDADIPYDVSVCKIIAKIDFYSEERGIKTSKLSESDVFPYAQLANPFTISRSDNALSSVGFPGIGPSESAVLTRGEFLGYENSKKSILNHSCLIAGGNSGGALFYKDKLIGINTWSFEDRGNTIAKAQPVTYWGWALAASRLWYEAKTLPVIQSVWLENDPSEDTYKKEVFLGLNIVSRTNENNKISQSEVYLFKKEVSLKEAKDYIELYRIMKAYETIHVLKKQGYDIAAIASYLKLSTDVVGQVVQMNQPAFFKNIKPELKKYIKIYQSKEFYSKNWQTNQNGQVILSVFPKGEFQVAVVKEGYEVGIFQFESGSDVFQGPYTLKMEPVERR
ncbi:MAG: hypothetical protein A2Y41_13405 [Spirochaetes bacterium GWB1_36_13]|nr:MAG: hypothetical protein A2Y41_13405 [Spirochaetes bacterium GWB1_36_13]